MKRHAVRPASTSQHWPRHRPPNMCRFETRRPVPPPRACKHRPRRRLKMRPSLGGMTLLVAGPRCGRLDSQMRTTKAAICRQRLSAPPRPASAASRARPTAAKVGPPQQYGSWGYAGLRPKPPHHISVATGLVSHSPESPPAVHRSRPRHSACEVGNARDAARPRAARCLPRLSRALGGRCTAGRAKWTQCGGQSPGKASRGRSRHSTWSEKKEKEWGV